MHKVAYLRLKGVVMVKNLRLLQARTEMRLTQKEMATLLGLSIRGYQQLETYGMLPNLKAAIRIADALGVTDLRKLWNVDSIKG